MWIASNPDMLWFRKSSPQLVIAILLLFTSCLQPSSNGGFALSGNSSLHGGSSGNSVEIIDGSSPNSSDAVDVPSNTQLGSSSTEGYQLPVTIAKLEAWPNARLLKATVGSNSNKETKVIISGDENAVDPNYQIAARIQGQEEILTTVTPNSDGSFQLEVDESYASQPIDIFYVKESETEPGVGIPVTAVADNADTFKILIHDVAAIPNEDVSIQDDFVFYNYKIAENQYEIRYQDLSGGPLKTFATTTSYIQKLSTRITKLNIKKTEDGIEKKMTCVYGIEQDSQALVRLTPDGQIFYLSDVMNGDLDPFTQSNRNAIDAHYATHVNKSYAITHYTSADASIHHPFYMIPLESIDEGTKDDLIFTLPESTPPMNVEFAYDAMNNMVSLGKYQILDPQGLPIEGKYRFFMKYMGNSKAENLTLDQFIEYNEQNNNIQSFAYAHILETEIPISNPIIKLEPNPTHSRKPPFSWVMECEMNGHKHICTFNRSVDDEPQQLTKGDFDYFQPTLSSDYEFLAYVRRNPTNGASDIVVRHLKTQEEYAITAASENQVLDATTYAYNFRPKFAGYTIFFLTGNDGSSFYPAILNLNNHNVLAQYIKGSSYCNPEKFPDEDPETACLTAAQLQELELKKIIHCIDASLISTENEELEQSEICFTEYDYRTRNKDDPNSLVVKMNTKSFGEISATVDKSVINENPESEDELCYPAYNGTEELELDICFDILDFSTSVDHGTTTLVPLDSSLRLSPTEK